MENIVPKINLLYGNLQDIYRFSQILRLEEEAESVDNLVWYVGYQQ